MCRKLLTNRNRNRFSGAQYALFETQVHHQMNDDTPAFVSFMPVSVRCSPSDGGVCGHKQGRYVLSVVNVAARITCLWGWNLEAERHRRLRQPALEGSCSRLHPSVLRLQQSAYVH